MEEVSLSIPRPTPEPESPKAPPPEPNAEKPKTPEPQAVASNQTLRLWTYPSIGLKSESLIEATRLDLEPMPYVRGGPISEAGDEIEDQPLEKSVRPLEETAQRSPEPEEPKPTTAEDFEGPPVEFAFRSLGINSSSSPTQGGARRVIKLVAAATCALALAAAGYFGLWNQDTSVSAGPVSETAAADKVPEKDWIGDWSQSHAGEQIALFAPSKEWSDYRVESVTRPEQAVAWVFRARDPRNYYTLSLENGASGEVVMVRNTVIDGGRGEKQRTAFTLPVSKESYGVSLEVRGSAFTLFLEGTRVAGWEDSRLRSGGFGVINPNPDFAQRKSLKVTQLAPNSAFRAIPPGASAEIAAITITRIDGALPEDGRETKESN